MQAVPAIGVSPYPESLSTAPPARTVAVRWLIPSLTDLLFLAIIVWLFAADPAGWDRLVWDGDVALHTRTGDYILDHGAIPSSDVFSFTMPGERWIAFQWLTGIGFALLNRWGGLKGIVLFCGVIIALYHTILLRDMIRHGANGLFAILLVLFGCNAASIHFHARPHLWTLLFLAISGLLIANDRARPSNRFWIVVPLTAVWANLHSGFPVVIALLGLLALGSGISALLGDRPWAPARRYGVATALCGLASLLNPNGWELHRHILEFIANPWVKAHVNEYQRPVFNSEAMIYFLVLLVIALCFCILFVRRRQWTECLWIAFFAYSALTSARHIPLFLVVAIPLIGVAGTQLWNQFASRARRGSVLAIVNEQAELMTARLKPISLWPVAAVGAILLVTPPQSWPRDLSAKYFPTRMVREHAAELAAARVFTSDQWGDYLLWVNYPRQQVFIDGRSDFFGETVGNEYIAVNDAATGWQAILRKYKVDTALLAPDSTLAHALEREPGWKVVAKDRMSVLFSNSAR
jgi:hypothetical protein